MNSAVNTILGFLVKGTYEFSLQGIDDFGNQMKRFDSKDGIGIKLLQKYGFEIALISGSKSNSIKARGIELDINFIMTGVEDKHVAIKKIQTILNINPSQTIFLGDDIND